MFTILGIHLPVISFGILLWTGLSGAVHVDTTLGSLLSVEGLTATTCEDRQESHMAADVFEPRDDNDGQPQETVG